MSVPSTEPVVSILVKPDSAIERLSQRQTFALRASNIGVWEYNIKEGSLVWDEQMYSLYGITADNFSGAYETWEQGLHPDDLEQGRIDLQDAIAGVRKLDTEFRVVWSDGQIRYLSALGDVFYDEFGQPSYMFGVNEDITESKKMQESLLQSNKDLQHFSYIVAHDLREPCIRQQALSQMALEDNAGAIPADLELILEHINKQADQMLGMIDSFRALANIGSKPLSKKQFDMQEAAQLALAEYSDEMQNVTINVNLKVSVNAYPDLIGILFKNLISNAIRYGCAPLELSLFHEIEHDRVLFVVENTSNVDISEDKNLFQAFVRNTAESEGEGIGLSICKRVIDYHSGSIWIEPKPDLFCIKFYLGSAGDG